jgi:hypothetical protein
LIGIPTEIPTKLIPVETLLLWLATLVGGETINYGTEKIARQPRKPSSRSWLYSVHPSLAVLPRGRNFGRKTQKGPKNCDAGKIWGRIFGDFSKKGRKGAELFVVCFCTKTVIFLQKILNFSSVIFLVDILKNCFIYYLAL